jgi:hypothetical protein
MATFTMTDSQQSTFSITAYDKMGNPTTLPPGSVSWAVDLTTLISLTPATDGMSCLVKAVGPLGTAVVSCRVSNADGTTLAAGSIDVGITSGAAVTIKFDPGTPVEQA